MVSQFSRGILWIDKYIEGVCIITNTNIEFEVIGDIIKIVINKCSHVITPLYIIYFITISAKVYFQTV